jgi:hypothetical protein
MIRLVCGGLLLLFGNAGAIAQEYTAPDAELWRQMTEALAGISMPLPAHQQVQIILQNVQREAQMRAARAKVAEHAKEKKD